MQLESDDEADEKAAGAEPELDEDGEAVLGECMACEEPVFASEGCSQCSRCTGLLHISCGGAGGTGTRSRKHAYLCPACKGNSK
jgi:hypothetical protein